MKPVPKWIYWIALWCDLNFVPVFLHNGIHKGDWWWWALVAFGFWCIHKNIKGIVA